MRSPWFLNSNRYPESRELLFLDVWCPVPICQNHDAVLVLAPVRDGYVCSICGMDMEIRIR